MLANLYEHILETNHYASVARTMQRLLLFSFFLFFFSRILKTHYVLDLLWS